VHEEHEATRSTSSIQKNIQKIQIHLREFFVHFVSFVFRSREPVGTHVRE